ncbi:hypothetical protein LG296_21215 (plasmid) [Ureibacillus chungkukjangi]|uniref:hypothetical protein n=1 Tax=Ureibacillus chungkukjangi TaxID=1202712 RepID=UPI000D39FB46|nr:hypothetical protein [Ureibacillus chungkukjangi]MCM3390209.1 hypothetical protein [Ureibacillus chungkukjangi]
MTNPIISMYKYVVSLLLFLGALAYTVFSITETQSAFDELPTHQTVYNVQTQIPEDVYWTGAQVVGKLYRLTEDNVPVVVDGFTYLTDKEVRDNQNLVNLDALYKRKFSFNDKGEIESIYFTTK